MDTDIPYEDRSTCPAARRGFTLVELLVVIGIIAVLVSILLPSLARARQSALQSTCLSNMRQIGSALSMYINDNKGWPPYQPNMNAADFAAPAILDSTDPNNWSVFGRLLPYLANNRSVLLCPSTEVVGWGTGPPWGPTQYSETNYMPNGVMMDIQISRIRDSSELIIMQEDAYRWGVCWMRPAYLSTAPAGKLYWCWSVGGGSYGSAHPFDMEKPSKSGGNVLFADGHSEFRLRNSLRPIEFGLRGGNGATGKDTDENLLDYWYTFFSIYP